MNKQTIITILLALVAVAGQAQVKCHVEGTLETDMWGDEIIICEAGTDLRKPRTGTSPTTSRPTSQDSMWYSF